MALINCPDCEREISSQAPVCPHCGCPREYFNISDQSPANNTISQSTSTPNEPTVPQPLKEVSNTELHNSKLSVVALLVAFFGAGTASGWLIILAFLLCAADYLTNPFNRKYTFLFIALAFAIIGVIIW